MCGKAYYKDGRRYWSSHAPRLPQDVDGQMALHKDLPPPERRQAELFQSENPPTNSRKRSLTTSTPELDVKRVKQDLESPQLEPKPQAGPTPGQKEENATMCVDNNRLKESVHSLEEKVTSLEDRIYGLEKQTRGHGEQMNSLKEQLAEAERKRVALVMIDGARRGYGSIRVRVEVLKPGQK